MTSSAHITLRTRTLSEVRSAMRAQLANDPVCDTAVLSSDEEGIVVVLTESVTEQTATARIRAAASRSGVHPANLDIRFDPPPRGETVMRLSIPGPLDRDERTTAYGCIMAIAERAGAYECIVRIALTEQNTPDDGIRVEMRLPGTVTVTRMIQMRERVRADSPGDEKDILDRMEVHVLPPNAEADEMRATPSEIYAQMTIRPRPVADPFEWRGLRETLTTLLGRQGWVEVKTIVSDAEETAILHVPHRNPQQAGQEIASAIAATPGAHARASVSLLSASEATKIVGVDATWPSPLFGIAAAL